MPGRVADFCPVCCDIVAHEVPRPPTDDAPLTERCTQCGVVFRTSRDSILSVDHDDRPLPELIRFSRPALPRQCIAAIDQIRRVAAGSAPQAERTEMLRSPFLGLARWATPPVGPPTHNLPVDWLLAIAALILTPPLILAAFKLAARTSPAAQAWVFRNVRLQEALMTIAAILAGITALSLVALLRRRARQRRARVFARALRPFRPTHDELAAIAAWLRDTRHPYAPTDFTRVQAEMHAMTDTSLRNIEEHAIEQRGRDMHLAAEITPPLHAFLEQIDEELPPEELAAVRDHLNAGEPQAAVERLIRGLGEYRIAMTREQVDMLTAVGDFLGMPPQPWSRRDDSDLAA